MQARPPPSGNTTSVGERRRQASPRSDQGFLRAGAGIHRRQADRDHTEAGWLAQEAAHGSRPQAGRARGVSQALFPGWRPTGDEAARLAPVAATLRDAIRERGLKSRSEEHTSELQSLMRISY